MSFLVLFRPICRYYCRRLRRLAFNGEVHRTRAERGDHPPSEAAGTIDHVVRYVLSFSDSEFDRFLDPGIVKPKLVLAGFDYTRGGLAVHQNREGFAVQFEDDLALLNVGGRLAADGN